MKKRISLVFALLGILFFIAGGLAKVKANDLALGKSAKAKSFVDIAIASPAELNFKPRDEVFRLRAQEVLRHPELVQGKYFPSAEVFGQIVDRKPWWGVYGQSYFGAGQNSIKGPSEESRFILNPFLLVGECSTPGLINVDGNTAISKRLQTFYQPMGLRWYPAQGKAEVTYELSAYKSAMSYAMGYSNFNLNGSLHFEAINARDLGLAYFYIPPSWAYNIKIGSPMNRPASLPQFIHCGGSCGYPGGCNNMSPHCEYLDNYTFTNLPARLSFMFWKKPPVTGKEPPDMVYTMNFR